MVHMAVVGALGSMRRSIRRYACGPHETTPARPRGQRERGDRVTVSRHDRFGAMIVAGQRIAQAQLVDEIRAALCEAARSLLEAERCAILEGGAGEDDAPLVAAVLRSGRVLVWPADDGTISSPAEARCALCAPIPASGRP